MFQKFIDVIEPKMTIKISTTPKGNKYDDNAFCDATNRNKFLGPSSNKIDKCLIRNVSNKYKHFQRKITANNYGWPVENLKEEKVLGLDGYEKK